MSDRLTDGRDIIDTREIIERIAELRAEWADVTGADPDDYQLSGDDYLAGLAEGDRDELVALEEFRDEYADCFPEWKYGETLIRDDYFTTYAQELADDMGVIPADYSWPASYIDWERAARDLRMDYTATELDGVTYWGRP